MALEEERQAGDERTPDALRHHPGLGASGRGHAGSWVSTDHRKHQPGIDRRLHDHAGFAHGHQRTLVTEADWRIATFVTSSTAFLYVSIFLYFSGFLR